MIDFSVQINTNILNPEHVHDMGGAIWVYLWLLKKVTKIESGVATVGDGKVVKLSDIAGCLGSSPATISRNLDRLERNGYITAVRASHGSIITINKIKTKEN